MTATVHHPTVHHPTVHRTQPNYALRRLGASMCAVVLLVLAAHVAVGAAGALAGLDSRPAAASETVPAAGGAPTAGGAVVRTVHVAEPGDTLWSIADRHRGDVDRGRFVDRLIDLNGGTSIQVGQAVRLP